jgi:hypothetical protein
MKQDFDKPDMTSPDGLSPDALVSDAADDAELARLVSDAYEVPAIPRTLLKRLDRGVEELWGVTPGVSRRESSGITRFASRAIRRLRSWPLAAGVAVAVALAVIFSGGGNSYSWAAMVEALSRQSVVQIGSDSDATAVRWLSVKEGLVGEQSATDWRLLDFRRGVVLERSTDETQVRRRQVDGLKRVASRDHMVMALLTGSNLDETDLVQRTDLSVLSEHWIADADEVQLSVTFGNGGASGTPVRLKITLDGKTHLPLVCEIVESNVVRELVVSYPATDVAQLVATGFPSDLPVVTVAGASVGEVALAPTDREGTGIVDPAPDHVATVVNADNQPRDAPEDRPSIGSASLVWKAVQIPDAPRSEIVSHVDDALANFWQDSGFETSPPATDAELLRRAYLDLVGRTPSVNEVRDWLADSSADRYPALVNRLLNSRDHATHLATVWRTFLLPEGVDLDRYGGVEAFDEWLSEQFQENVPYDELVRRLMLAEGRLTKSGPLLFYTALKLDADLLAARTARVFLGMRLECAQCHDDPFEPWTQDDFWSYAAFFARISRPQAALETVSTVMQVRDVDRGEVMLPDTEDVVPPRFLDGTAVDESPEAEARRHQLAKWLTGPSNPYFARAAANRVWAHLVGRGIVDPVDGFGERNVPRSPELLDLLAGHFIDGGFNLREQFRAVALSRAYRLSSGSEETDPERMDYFAQMNVKTLTAEQVYDCITVATMLVSENGSGMTIERVGNSSREDFLQTFRTPSGKPTEYQGGIPQALTLMNGTLIADATGLASSGLLKTLEAPFFTDDQRIEVLYLATLSRPPSTSEWDVLKQYVNDRDDGISIQEPLADILWALLNGAEFTMNH